MSSNSAVFVAEETLYRSGRVVVERGIWDGARVVAKRAGDDNRTRAEARIRYEHDLLRMIDSPHVVRPLELLRTAHGPMLIMQDVAGRPLDQLDLPLSIENFLAVALDLCRAVADVHRAGIIHKDVKPANAIATPDRRVVLLDFNVSTRCSRETQGFSAPRELEGTLAFLSPEQTGRMNRPLDYRADLYSLGATFYYLLTGHPPFTATDPLELIHAHLAQTAPRLRQVPAMIDEIIQRLLAKDAEVRYQSAEGLYADLARCDEQLRARGELSSFALGAQDHARRFMLPTKIYGRDEEADRMRAVFADLTRGGPARLVTVAGYSGIGKTSLVHEVHRPLVETRGYYATGKFDQFKRDLPFSALADAMTDLARQILTEDEARIAGFGARMLEALQGEGHALVELIPLLESILGPQPAIESLTAQDSQARIRRLFRSLFTALGAPEHPLVIFVDDVQWADEGTLAVMEDIAQLDARVLFIVAYRDNEVSDAHPLVHALARLQPQIAEQIRLRPLSEEVVTQMTADTLGRSVDDVRELGAVLAQKTAGNPFFLGQLLTSLHQDELVVWRNGRWEFDLAEVREKGVTDNVVDLLCRKIQRASAQVANILRYAACIGAEFDVPTLAMVMDAPHEEVDRWAHDALAGGFVVHLRDDVFKFLHDRVQQAAYTLVPEDERPRLHKRIADHLARSDRGERLLQIAGQYNQAHSLLDAAERIDVAKLNLLAALRANRSGAPKVALVFADAGLALADRAPPEVRFDLRLAKAEAQSALSMLSEVDANLDVALRTLEVDVPRRVRALQLQASCASAQNNPERSLSFGYAMAEALGANLHLDATPEETLELLAAVRAKFEGAAPGSFAALPPSESPEFLAMAEAVPYLSPAAYWLRPLTLFAMNAEVVLRSFEKGRAPDAGYALAIASIGIQALFNDLPSALRIHREGLEFARLYAEGRSRARSEFLYPYFAAYLHDTHENIQALYRRAAVITDRVSETEFWGYSVCLVPVERAIEIGMDEECDQLFEHTLDILAKRKLWSALGVPAFAAQLGRFLRGDEPAQEDLAQGSVLDHPELRGIHLRGGTGLAQHRMMSIIYRLLLDDAQGAAASLDGFAQWSAAIAGTRQTAWLWLYGGIAAIETGLHADFIASARSMLATFARMNPGLFTYHHHLFEAELARKEGDASRASAEYERAAAQAESAGASFPLAFISKRAARFWTEQRNPRVALAYAQTSLRAFEHLRYWLIAERMLEEFPALRGARASRTEGPTTAGTVMVPSSVASTTAASRSHVDFWSVIKATQILSSEVRLERLHARLMQVVCENAGARRAVLVMRSDADFECAAELHAGEPRSGGVPLAGSDRVPENLVRFVLRTREHVLIDDVAGDERWRRQAYFQGRGARSVLCLPIDKGGQTFGALYLENDLSSRAFTEQHVQVLKLLASQAAISIENARYIETESERKRIAQEMAVAAALQLALVPDAPALPGCEVAVHMTPATEVGGDYYDFVRAGERDWIVIADVSGHGLTAGLVMMMCQTALHAALATRDDLAPADVLRVVNKVLYENLQRLSETKYVTCTVLRREPDGSLTYAGLHESLLVYRAREQRVESIETQGAWLGVVGDLSDRLPTARLSLGEGDVLLLYTDGVSESRSTRDGSMLDELGLRELFARSGTLSAAALRDAILVHLRAEYTQDDDVTLVVVKQRAVRT